VFNLWKSVAEQRFSLAAAKPANRKKSNRVNDYMPVYLWLPHCCATLHSLHWPDLDEDLSFRGLIEGDSIAADSPGRLCKKEPRIFTDFHGCGQP
jgi:hypothetical protein